MKTFRSNAKIEYRTLLLSIDNDGSKRYLQFRICSSELNLWQRLFQNQWYDVFTAFKCFEGVNFLFDIKEVKEIISKYKTWGEINAFLKNEIEIANRVENEKRLKKINNELKWKDLE